MRLQSGRRGTTPSPYIQLAAGLLPCGAKIALMSRFAPKAYLTDRHLIRCVDPVDPPFKNDDYFLAK